jgi:hypothetical protein
MAHRIISLLQFGGFQVEADIRWQAALACSVENAALHWVARSAALTCPIKVMLSSQ